MARKSVPQTPEGFKFVVYRTMLARNGEPLLAISLCPVSVEVDDYGFITKPKLPKRKREGLDLVGRVNFTLREVRDEKGRNKVRARLLKEIEEQAREHAKEEAAMKELQAVMAGYTEVMW